jgi:primosomal protein N' (replication factor Y)
MVCQVSGRAGRKEKKGNVIIQTQRPTHPILKSIIDNDFLALYRKEIIERKEYFYPPFSRMIRFLFKSKTKELAMLAAGYFVKLSSSFLETKNILGPQAPGIDKVQDYYLQLVYIKIARDSGDLNHIKKALKTAMNRTVQRDDLRSVQIIADVDCL